MSEATFSEDAEADLLDIAEFIARDNPIAAREWVDAVRQR
jgi:plasmid stabilization system protein ParE